MRRLLFALLAAFMVASVPVLLVLMGVRLAMTPLFLTFEYTRADFPADFYGMKTDERMTYAPYAVEYLLNDAPVSFLGDLRFPDGSPLFNMRELGHMRDVKAVTQSAFAVAMTLGLVWIAGAFLFRRQPTRIGQILIYGGLVTIGLIAAIVIAVVVNWDFFFTGFHQIFFEGGTWQFAYSDTLIRLFPEQFWFDAALLIGGFTLIGAVLLILGGRRLLRRPS
jgi:integral membrane protein (TIGR01906 family)